MSDTIEYKPHTTRPKPGFRPTGDGWMNAAALDALAKEKHIANLLTIVDLATKVNSPVIAGSAQAAVVKLQALGVLAGTPNLGETHV